MKNTYDVVIRSRLQFDAEFLLKCVRLLYDKQEDQEQEAQTTLYNNGVGFNKSDAVFLTGWLQSMEGSQEDRDRAAHYTAEVGRTMLKYTNQLANYLTVEDIEN